MNSIDKPNTQHAWNPPTSRGAHRNHQARAPKDPTPDNPLTVDPRALDAVLICIASATRFIERHDSLTLGPLARDIDEIGRVVRQIRTGQQEPDAHEPFEIMSAMNRLNQLIARADALAHAAQRISEIAALADADADELRQRRERIAHLVGDAAEAASDAAEASQRILLQLGQA